MCASCNRWHSFTALANSGRCLRVFLRPISIQTKNPVFSVLNSFTFCSCVEMPFQSDPVVKHDFLFPNTVLRQWLPVSFLSIPSWKYRRMAPMLVLTCLFQHLPCPEVHYICLSDGPCFAPLLEFFFMTKLRDRSEVAIVLLGSWRTSWVLPQLQ